jgi:septum site-determining protein MinC
MLSSFIIQIMPKIAIKQNKKGTFLDLSSQDLAGSSFKEDFSSFSNEISSFLSGTSVSIIMPEVPGKNQSIIEEIRTELNKNNISLKNVFSKDEDKTDPFNEEDTKNYVRNQESNTNKEIVDVSTLPETLYVEANLRSGQLIRYPGNVFVLGDVNPSAEIIANGDIIIWGTLRGLAHAGADGDKTAKIIAMEILAGQIRIAGLITSIPNSMSKEKKKSKDKIPMLVKIENNEIIASRYFG